MKQIKVVNTQSWARLRCEDQNALSEARRALRELLKPLQEQASLCLQPPQQRRGTSSGVIYTDLDALPVAAELRRDLIRKGDN
ncbi:hypothetical protein [Paracoccus laeviglucosivorans]|uniref:Uncharacterized protein n=1 Tax=Paracoccus laeviglucosivorans TaxID=1197861 RepID=A0A521FSW0_9RHOB|nr:hypothetical protein [Paracoccus laeviglucosivorans]SMO98581.1 hypothetical protein SAMN06265221_13512 [Paracoccus laeviglucosivorans]